MQQPEPIGQTGYCGDTGKTTLMDWAFKMEDRWGCKCIRCVHVTSIKKGDEFLSCPHHEGKYGKCFGFWSLLPVEKKPKPKPCIAGHGPDTFCALCGIDFEKKSVDK